jgi:hypothetical protein
MSTPNAHRVLTCDYGACDLSPNQSEHNPTVTRFMPIRMCISRQGNNAIPSPSAIAGMGV